LQSIDTDAPMQDMRDLWQTTPGSTLLDRMLWFDWQYTLADNDLRKVETMSELAGVRVSYPMLDDRLVALSMRIPAAMKMPRGELRGFYKQAMRGFLPEEIIHKKKHGFGLPFGLWLRDSPSLREQVNDNLASLRQRRIVQPGLIDKLLDLQSREDVSYYGVFVWVLAIFEQWLREHQLDV
jgi:asparagine synthase (glutamine-hydrolysing)